MHVVGDQMSLILYLLDLLVKSDFFGQDAQQ